MRIEEQLRAAAEQVPATWPGEAGAYQRFQHRRRRASRLLVAATSGAFVAVLAVGLLVPKVLGGSAPTDPLSGSERTVTRPQQGFQLSLPPGWTVVQSAPGDVVLSFRTKSHQTVHMSVRIALSADKRVNGGITVEQMSSPLAGSSPGYSDPAGRRSYSKRPDGRTVLKAEQRSIEWSVDYQVAWPYSCPAGAPCPELAKARVLDFEVSALAVDWPQVRPQVERIVNDARPIANGAGEPTPLAGRTACKADDSIDNLGGGSLSAAADVVEVEAGAVTRNLTPCSYHRRFALVVTVNGHRADIDGNGSPVTLDAAMPEGAPSGNGMVVARWRWTNWCGGPGVQAKVVDLDHQGGGQDLTFKPSCTDRSRPSVIEVVGRASN